MADRINLNTARAKDLTQLPGVAKNVAYHIVSRRKRHGYFTHGRNWAEVKESPPQAAQALDRLKERTALLPIEGVLPEEFGPRRTKPEHLKHEAKKPRVYPQPFAPGGIVTACSAPPN